MDWGFLLQALIAIAVGLVASFLVAAVILITGFRSRSPRIRRAIARINRSTSNPRQLETAGRPGAAFSTVTHRGRTSGREFRTPVGAVVADGSVVVPLPYGAEADWVRNVLAVGEALLDHEGERFALVNPRIVPLDTVRAKLPAADRRSTRLFGVREALTAELRA